MNSVVQAGLLLNSGSTRQEQNRNRSLRGLRLFNSVFWQVFEGVGQRNSRQMCSVFPLLASTSSGHHS